MKIFGFYLLINFILFIYFLSFRVVNRFFSAPCWIRGRKYNRPTASDVPLLHVCRLVFSVPFTSEFSRSQTERKKVCVSFSSFKEDYLWSTDKHLCVFHLPERDILCTSCVKCSAKLQVSFCRRQHGRLSASRAYS